MISDRQSDYVATLRLFAMKDRLSDAERTLTGARRLQAGGPARPPARLGRRVDVARDDAPGFPLWTLRARRPAAGAPGRTVLYVHGGGYIMDFTPQHWAFMADLAERTGADVLAPQYPLAPDHTWRDSFPRLLDLARGAGGAPPPVLMGDSAGGGYALALAQALAAEGGHAPETVLISPFVDATLAHPETAAHDETDPWLAAEGLRVCGRAWAAVESVRAAGFADCTEERLLTLQAA
ncbi:alpha/beta hydrolase fold domain-containing protein, partial [Streptomyces sp. URMC 129]|uniref:alpha/beta hydrolase fold domain-containing protein n=1 Tax=Streptomyces sp. URMC 129 TaxID=3423407 RepID=UPI003F1DD942